MGKPFMKVTKDFTQDLSASIKALKDRHVLVGIPKETSDRKMPVGEMGERAAMNNATLLFINNFGSPVNNIPPRPVMQIGIKNAQPQIEAEMRACALAVLSKGPAALDQYYERVGIIGSNSIKAAINDQEFSDGPSEATLARRQALGFKGTKSLIVTGQMRNAITYVVRDKK